MGYWQRHQDKDLEKILEAAHDGGWRIERDKRYYKLFCGCGDHKTGLHLSPSDPKHGMNRLGYMKRQPCWKGQK